MSNQKHSSRRPEPSASPSIPATPQVPNLPTSPALPASPAAAEAKDLRLVAYEAFTIAVPDFLDAFDTWRKAPPPRDGALQTRLVDAYAQLQTVQEFARMLNQFAKHSENREGSEGKGSEGGARP